VGGAAAVLGARRLAALVVLAAALAVYFAVHASLPRLTVWWDIAVLSFLVIPAVFATVLLLLPLWRAPGRWVVGVVCAGLAVGFSAAGWSGAASFAKLGAATFLAWWFLDLFEDVSWVVLVAVIIPWVDAFSVFRGPTKQIVTHHRGVFGDLSFGFPVPGEHGTANLGIPDLIFFALFLAATERWSLRRGFTWLLMTASFGATITLAVWWNPAKLHGLPALPLLSLAFFVANGDLLWRRWKERPARPEQT
jgi:hypothetical protein